MNNPDRLHRVMAAVTLVAALLVVLAACTSGAFQEFCATGVFVVLIVALIISVLEARVS